MTDDSISLQAGETRPKRYIPKAELPQEVKDRIDKLLFARKKRALWPMGGVLGTIAGVISEATFSSFLTGALITSGLGLISAKVMKGQIARRTASIARAVYRNKTTQVISEAIQENQATHVKVDHKGNVHFINAPERLKGKMFRPFFSRLHAPLQQEEREKHR